MFPIGDQDVRGAGSGLVTWGLIIVNVLVFLFEITLSQPALENLFQQYGAVPVRILSGENYVSLLTSMFLHGGWWHLISNMLFLWVFGDNIEAVLGHFRYIVFYLLGGMAASAAHVFINTNSSIPSVGASGAIAAVLGSYLVMFPRAKVKVLFLLGFYFTVGRISALLFLGIWAILQLFNGIASLGVPTAQTGGVAFWAHIGGFVIGLLAGFLFKSTAERLALEQE